MGVWFKNIKYNVGIKEKGVSLCREWSKCDTLVNLTGEISSGRWRNRAFNNKCNSYLLLLDSFPRCKVGRHYFFPPYHEFLRPGKIEHAGPSSQTVENIEGRQRHTKNRMTAIRSALGRHPRTHKSEIVIWNTNQI